SALTLVQVITTISAATRAIPAIVSVRSPLGRMAVSRIALIVRVARLDGSSCTRRVAVAVVIRATSPGATPGARRAIVRNVTARRAETSRASFGASDARAPNGTQIAGCPNA